MQTGNSIIMHAPRESIFETAADLAGWPRILPHYRYIRFLDRRPERSIVEMAALRSGIPISWTSEFVVDRERMELRFLHLKAFTRGMRVVWTFKETPAGVLVEIMHALRFRVAALAPIAGADYRRFLRSSCGQPDAAGDENACRKKRGSRHRRPRLTK